MNSRVIARLTATCVLALGMAACSGSAGSSTPTRPAQVEPPAPPAKTVLEDALDQCKDLSDGDTLTVSDDGSSMFIDTADENDILGYAAYSCVGGILKFSEPLQKSVENTTALMGTKEWSENGYLLEWTYHPDNGLDMSIRLAN